jgi:hypothetical protein
MTYQKKSIASLSAIDIENLFNSMSAKGYKFIRIINLPMLPSKKMVGNMPPLPIEALFVLKSVKKRKL